MGTSKAMKRVHKNFEEKLLEAFRLAVVEVGEELRRSPVDNCRFVNNWMTYDSKWRRNTPNPSDAAALEELRSIAADMTLESMWCGVSK